ncbi:hypothetical protein PGT21_016208 [Puccinia graminis f. sp. tritici]|uniref:Uncharacterized protein n=1 Tax=Puccinia graminis f. sp. tritici TaxID=56615 RepID=A0A5B0N4V8_PUCGR|nr:hypothetical protein PGTUg99_014210 [Puccinia graminis f. sp. tritici]KAA1094280.1 hypothetical protein PGT21_016208 [Puccinia graminis f. sp. tritici]
MNTKESTPASAESANSSEKSTSSEESDHLPAHQKQLSTKPEEEDSEQHEESGSCKFLKAIDVVNDRCCKGKSKNISEFNFIDASSEYVSLAASVNKHKVAPKKMFEINGKIFI